jgi:hypothetical protein
MKAHIVPSRRPVILASFVLLSAVTGCAKGEARRASMASQSAPVALLAPASAPARGGLTSEPAARRVVRTADLSLEADAPDSVSAKAGALVAARDGFVVSSDTSNYAESDGTEHVNVTLVLRVPEPAFDATLAGLRGLGTRVASEKVSGQDVTEEYVDLEARLKAQRAIEDQYLAVLKDAHSIPDVLAVEQKLGEVRTEIERAEGRRRYLENQSSLATVTVHVARTVDAIDSRGLGFALSVHEAERDAVSTMSAIVNGAIRGAGVLGPVTILLGLPLYAVLWVLRRRRGAMAAGARPA